MKKCYAHESMRFGMGFSWSHPTLSYAVSTVMSCVEGHAKRVVDSFKSTQPSVVVQDAVYGLAKLPLTLFQKSDCDHISVDDQNEYIPNACQPAYVDQFEAQWNVDVALEWGAATATDFQRLSAAFLTVHQILPMDVGLIQFLSISNQSPSCLGGGNTWGISGEMNLFNQFRTDRVPCNEEIPGWVAPNYLGDYSIDIYYKDRLLATLVHELGHLVDGQSGDSVSVNRYGRLGSSETFAEDYRIYALSNGHEVMRTNGRGEIIPYYEDRLHYMQFHVYLATGSISQTLADTTVPFTCADARAY